MYASFELKLQLHGQVSNPYSFKIKGNYKASAINKVQVPPYKKLSWTTPGTYTWSIPNGVSKLKVTVAGAGGGGASGDRYYDGVYGGTGGRGEGITKTVSVTGSATCSITVGTGGAAGVQGASGHPTATNGQAGGSSSLKVGSTTITARGGGGGTAAHRGSGAGTNGTSYNGGASGGQSGAYPADDFRGPKSGSNGWVYIEYGQGIE